MWPLGEEFLPVPRHEVTLHRQLWFATGTVEGELDILFISPQGKGFLAADVFQKDGMFCTCWKMINTLEKGRCEKRWGELQTPRLDGQVEMERGKETERMWREGERKQTEAESGRKDREEQGRLAVPPLGLLTAAAALAGR